MKAVNHSWWIGAIISTVLTFAFLGADSSLDVGMILFMGIVNGVFWGWIIGLIIDSIMAKTTKNKNEKDSLKNPINISKPNTSVNNGSTINSDRNEIAEILYEFSMNQNALEELKKIKSTDPSRYYNKFCEIFGKEVYDKTGVNLQLPETGKFKSFLFSFKPIVIDLDNGRGKLIFISNNLGDVFKNPEGRVICSNKYIILGIEEGKLTRWIYMHLTGRVHEPQVFLLKEDDILPCGSLPDSSFETLLDNLNSRLERTPTQADWDNLMDEFYNKI